MWLKKSILELTGKNTLCKRCLSVTNRSKQIRNDLNPLYIFDRKAKYLQRERALSADDVQVYDYIKDEIGYRVSDKILDIKRKFGKVADVGCGRGYISQHMLPDCVEELILCDSNQKNLDFVKVDEGIKVQRRVIDEEDIEFEPNSLDLVVSSLNLHWVNDLPRAFKAILDGLKPDGVFIASVFGGDSLYQLRSALQLAELERMGGLAPHISPFTDVRDVGNLLTRAGFTMLTIDTDELTVGYPSMFELMWDLKGMAENNAALNRSLHLNRDVQFAAAAIYEALYGKTDPENDGRFCVPATFQIINMLGWKPDKSHPKPLQRGTGEVSLKDLHKLDEIVKEIKKTRVDNE